MDPLDPQPRQEGPPLLLPPPWAPKTPAAARRRRAAAARRSPGCGAPPAARRRRSSQPCCFRPRSELCGRAAVGGGVKEGEERGVRSGGGVCHEGGAAARRGAGGELRASGPKGTPGRPIRTTPAGRPRASGCRTRPTAARGTRNNNTHDSCCGPLRTGGGKRALIGVRAPCVRARWCPTALPPATSCSPRLTRAPPHLLEGKLATAWWWCASGCLCATGERRGAAPQSSSSSSPRGPSSSRSGSSAGTRML